MKTYRKHIVIVAFFGMFLFLTGCQKEILPETEAKTEKTEPLKSVEAKAAGFAGVRHFAGIGTKSWSKLTFSKPGKGWIRPEWNKVMAKAVKEAPRAFDQHYPVLGAKLRWSRAYHNQNIKPTRKQAQDPNWSNYIWNRREDGLTNALNDPLIAGGYGQAKLMVIVALTSSSNVYAPPAWMQKDKSLTWEEGKNNNGHSGAWHVRFDNPKAVDHASDFMIAFLKKFGNNQGLHSIVLGEYYLGLKKERPSNLNRGRYFRGVRTMWERIVRAAPRDGKGNRVNIVQTNPALENGVTVNDMERIGIGISESDTRLDLPVRYNPKIPMIEHMRRLYNGKKVHVMMQGDGRYSLKGGRAQSWDGTPNPFGHRKGYSGVATPQELYWYHGAKGPAPLHTIIMAPVDYGNSVQSSQNILKAIKEFGRGGSKASEWGPSPAQMPWGKQR